MVEKARAAVEASGPFVRTETHKTTLKVETLSEVPPAQIMDHVMAGGDLPSSMIQNRNVVSMEVVETTTTRIERVER